MNNIKSLIKHKKIGNKKQLKDERTKQKKN